MQSGSVRSVRYYWEWVVEQDRGDWTEYSNLETESDMQLEREERRDQWLSFSTTSLVLQQPSALSSIDFVLNLNIMIHFVQVDGLIFTMLTWLPKARPNSQSCLACVLPTLLFQKAPTSISSTRLRASSLQMFSMSRAQSSTLERSRTLMNIMLPHCRWN